MRVKSTPTYLASPQHEFLGKLAFKKAPRRAHRFRPGTVALREIRREQRNTDPCIRRGAFERLVREVIQDFNPELRVKREAVDALQAAAEAQLLEVMDLANRLAIHSGRTTMNREDLALARTLRN